jgi:hypothetical protein
MIYFKTLDLVTLNGLLADFTDHYASLQITEANEIDLKFCKDTIDGIHLEIASREQIAAA